MTVPVIVPFKNVKIECIMLLINVVMKLVKIQLYLQLYFMVHLKKVLKQVEKFMLHVMVLKVKAGHFRDNFIYLVLVVEKLNFKR